MDLLKNFLKDANAVKVATTLATLSLAINFFFEGLFRFNIIFQVLSFETYGLYRVWAIVIGTVLAFVGYASYIQNKALVNESLNKAKERVAKEAKDLSEKAESAVEKQKGGEKVEEGEVVEKGKKNSKK